jgi:hypothetical protein
VCECECECESVSVSVRMCGLLLYVGSVLNVDSMKEGRADEVNKRQIPYRKKGKTVCERVRLPLIVWLMERGCMDDDNKCQTVCKVDVVCENTVKRVVV